MAVAAVLVLVLSSLLLGKPAAGFTDVMLGRFAQCSTSYFGCDKGDDGNETGTSRWEPSGGPNTCLFGANPSHPCYYWGFFAALSHEGLATFDHIRMNVYRDTTGSWAFRCGTGSPSTDESVDVHYGGLSVPGVGDTGSLELTTPCVDVEWASFSFYDPVNAGGAASISILAFSATQEGPSGTDITNLIYGLTAQNTVFSKTIFWSWALTFDGTYELRRIGSGDCVPAQLGGDAGCDSMGAVIGARGPDIVDTCGVGGCSGWTLHIEDTTDNLTADFTIPADSDGTLIPVPDAIHVQSVQGCFNLTTNQCGSGQASGTAAFDVTYAGGIYDGATLTICSQSHVRSDYCEGTPGYSASPYHAGTYYVIGIVVDVGRGPTWMAHVADGLTLDYRTVELDLVSGGLSPVSVEPVAPPGGTPAVCGTLDVGCQIGNGLQGIFGIGVGVLTAGFGRLHDVVVTKQPFATIFASGPAVLAQVGRAQDAITSTSTCSGVSFQMPTMALATPAVGWSLPTVPPQPTPTFTVLKCETFESIVSNWSWWSTFRSFQDVAIYTAYGFVLLKRFQPRAQIGS